MQPDSGGSRMRAPMPDGALSRYATVNGVRLHYVIAGSGDPLLLLHGWPETWYAWRKVIPVLADRFTVVAPDMRGYGDSERPVGGYDKVTVATDLHELMRSLGFGRIHLVAQDMGGPVGFAYAASFPADVREGFGDLSHASITQVADHVERQTIAEAKHFLVQDQPQAATEAILSFLARMDEA